MKLKLLFLILCSTPLHSQNLWRWIADDFNVIMATHGDISFAPYIHGDFDKFENPPGYRADFKAYVDFFEWKGLTSHWLIANTTIIESNEETNLKLDKIRYTLTPGYKIEFDSFTLLGQLLHECIHTISKPEIDGAVWWNSFQFGGGTKGAYPKGLAKTYNKDSEHQFPSFDFNINAGAFLYGGESVWIKQNHNYRYEGFSKTRIHIAKLGNWGFYTDINQHTWIDKFDHVENKIDFTFNILLSGKENIASVYYQYFIHDTFSKDNQDGLGAAGFKIIF